MPKEIMTEIKAYMDKQYDLLDSERIFTYTKALIRNNMMRGSDKAGIPFIRIHDLRHSHVSLLIELGFSAQLIAERIGDTVQMVNSTYGHLYPTRHREVADKLNSIIVPN